MADAGLCQTGRAVVFILTCQSRCVVGTSVSLRRVLSKHDRLTTFTQLICLGLSDQLVPHRVASTIRRLMTGVIINITKPSL